MAITELIPGRKYKVVVWGRRTPGGHRPRFTAVVNGGMREARAKERELYRMRDGCSVPSAKTHLFAYLDTYLNTRKREIAPQTYASYERQAARCRHIGSVRLRDCDASTVRHLYQLLADDGLTPRTIGHVHRFLSMALKRAVNDGLIAANPCQFVKPPKVERRPARTLDAAYAQKLLHDLAGTAVELPARVALATGIREGELLALKWSDLDLKRGTLTVSYSLEQVGSAVRRKETKTAASVRTVPLPEALVAALRGHRTEQRKRRLQYADLWQDAGYVFPSVCHRGGHLPGKAWSPGAFKAAWRKATRKAGWTIRFHDLRHTWATHMLRSGVPIETVAKLGGWSSTQVLLGTYSHAVARDDEKVAQAARALVG